MSTRRLGGWRARAPTRTRAGLFAECFAPGLDKDAGLQITGGGGMLRRMESHELLREVFQKTSPKHAACELGLSLSMVYKWTEPPAARSGAANPLDRVAVLVRCSGDERIVQWLCQQAGGFFIKNPKANQPHPAFLVPAMHHVVQEFADLLAVMARSAEDSQITAAEAKSIRARWEELKTVTEEFVRCCEEGNFRDLKHGLATRKIKGKPRAH
ncbi:MAG: phage regulatory CII family protein [Verrucomicrobiota bacterium]